MRNIIYTLLALIIFAGGYLTGRRRCPPATREIRIVRDTIIRTELQPVRTFTDGSRIPLVVTPPDTVYIEKETLVYSDSLYYAQVSGIRPNLDSLVIYPRHTIETLTNSSSGFSRSRHPAWGLGITAGATMTGKGLSPGITIGLTYTFASF